MGWNVNRIGPSPDGLTGSAGFVGAWVAGAWERPAPGAPLRALRGFTRVHVEAGAVRHVKLALQPRDLSYVNEAGDRMVAAGDYVISAGGGQPGTPAAQAEARLSIRGEQKLPE